MIIMKLNKNLSGLQRWKASGILKYWKIGTPHEYNSLLHAGEEELQPGEMAERIAEAWRLNRFLWDMLEHAYWRGTCSWRGEEGRLLTFVLTEAECRLWHEVMFWVFSGDRTFTIMATSIWNGYVSIWGLCVFAPSLQNAIVYLLLINLFILRRIIPFSCRESLHFISNDNNFLLKGQFQWGRWLLFFLKFFLQQAWGSPAVARREA